MEPAAIVAARDLQAVLTVVKQGSLRVFGDWFGRPMDNVHTVRSAFADGDELVITFHGDEELRLIRPRSWEFSETTFRVENADRVTWRWYSYGQPKTTAQLCTIEHWVDDVGNVRVRFDGSAHRPELVPRRDLPAAELL